MVFSVKLRFFREIIIDLVFIGMWMLLLLFDSSKFEDDDCYGSCKVRVEVILPGLKIPAARDSKCVSLPVKLPKSLLRLA